MLRAAEAKFKAGDTHGAYHDTRTILRENRHNGPAHLLMARLAVHRGAFADARDLLKIAIHLDGRTADSLALSSLCDLMTGDTAACVAHAQAALQLPSVHPETYDTLALVFHAQADYAKAVAALRLASPLDPDNQVIQVNLASALGLCGRADEALTILEDILKADPRNAKALGLRSELGRATPDKNDIPAIQRLLQTVTDQQTRLQLHHALARQIEALGDPLDALHRLSDGKLEFLKSRPEIDSQADQILFDRLEDLCAQAPARPRPATGPIFVGGMPRSGTTVVERLLTNGTGLKSIGECTRLSELAKQCGGSRDPRLVDADSLVRAWPHLPFEALGNSYRAHGRALVAGAPRFLDKMPLNVLLAPLIVSALPDARIVCTLRHPLDTIVGNFRQHFENVSGTYDYSLSLVRTAGFVARFHRYAQTLARLYPDQIKLVHYETLVRAPKQIAKSILDFCDIGWSDAVLDIENNLAPVGSASAVQVRAPIHSGYLARWKVYDALLEPAKAVLDSYDCDWRF